MGTGLKKNVQHWQPMERIASRTQLDQSAWLIPNRLFQVRELCSTFLPFGHDCIHLFKSTDYQGDIGETNTEKANLSHAVVAHACNPSYSGS
jgi:hypothetical protein